jgi:Arc-like DNA binding domain
MNRTRMQDAVAFNLRLPRSAYDAVREAAMARHVSMNTAIAQAVDHWLGTTARGDHTLGLVTEEQYRALQEQNRKLQEAYQDLKQTQQRLQTTLMRKEKAFTQMMQEVTQQARLFTEDEDISKTA